MTRKEEISARGASGANLASRVRAHYSTPRIPTARLRTGASSARDARPSRRPVPHPEMCPMCRTKVADLPPHLSQVHHQSQLWNPTRTLSPRLTYPSCEG
jgi:hypothetical protein